MITKVPQTSVQRAGIDRISVGQVGIGPIRIGRLVLDGLDVRMSAGSAQLQNFRVTIGLAMRLDWHLHVPIPVLPDIDERGTIDLGKPSFTVGLGDVTVPGLQDFSFRIDSLTAANIVAAASPLTDLQLGTAIAEQIRARNLSVPAQAFQISGLTIGSVRGDGIAVPAASVEDVSIGRVHGEALPMGTVAITNLALPGASVTDIDSQGLDVRGTQTPKAFHMDLGVLDLTLTVTPEARGQIDRFQIADITASAGVGRIEMAEVVAPYEFLNLTLSQIGIETIEIPTFSIA